MRNRRLKIKTLKNKISTLRTHFDTNPISIFCISLLLLSFSSISLSAQVVLEKDIQMTEYPAYYDLVRNSIIESQITDRFIKEKKVKSITESIVWKDTILPVQRLNYDSIGQLATREEFYYGALYFTEYFDYSRNSITVHNRRYSNKNEYLLSYKLDFDSLKNPIKYVSYDDENYDKGLDSIIYKYTYNSKGQILTKKQEMFYGTDDKESLLFKYKYDGLGNNTSYLVSNSEGQLYAAEKQYNGLGLLIKRNAIYGDGKYYYDRTEYQYNAAKQVILLKRTYRHDPSPNKEPDVIYYLFKYDDQGFLSEKAKASDHNKNNTWYKWAIYD